MRIRIVGVCLLSVDIKVTIGERKRICLLSGKHNDTTTALPNSIINCFCSFVACLSTLNCLLHRVAWAFQLCHGPLLALGPFPAHAAHGLLATTTALAGASALSRATFMTKIAGTSATILCLSLANARIDNRNELVLTNALIGGETHQLMCFQLHTITPIILQSAQGYDQCH